MTFGSLFAGIGGFDLGFERAGLECKWQVEINDYANRVLERHWPTVHRERDIRECGRHNLEKVDIICGGFPCQDVSSAGQRSGINGARSGLYAEMLRVCRELGPSYIVIENVDGLRQSGLAVVLRDLDRCGYDAEWEVLPACAFGASHRRKRVFVVAYPHRDRFEGVQSELQETPCKSRVIFTGRYTPGRRWNIELPTPKFCRSADGISNRAHRTIGLGNAVVPAVAQYVAERIVDYQKESER